MLNYDLTTVDHQQSEFLINLISLVSQVKFIFNYDNFMTVTIFSKFYCINWIDSISLFFINYVNINIKWLLFLFVELTLHHKNSFILSWYVIIIEYTNKFLGFICLFSVVSTFGIKVILA